MRDQICGEQRPDVLTGSVGPVDEVVIPELEAAPPRRNRPWSAWEEAVVRKYSDRPARVIAEALDRSVLAVRQKRQLLR